MLEISCEWGEAGVQLLADQVDVVVIVDVLSFSTSVDIATSRGAIVAPFKWRERHQAPANATGYTLSPSTLENIEPGYHLVLPSLNGSQLSTMAAGKCAVIAGCLRNAPSVARAAPEIGRRVAVIPAGERWADGSIRFALEDLVGAGAILAELGGDRSPDVELAISAFEAARVDGFDALRATRSAVEKLEQDLARDVELAFTYGVSDCVPVLGERGYSSGITL